MPILDVQKRYRELGRVRIGAKDERGLPTKLDCFRLTSPSLDLLKHASGLWGGIPTEWQGAPTEGTQYELVTESDILDVLVPPQNVADHQLMELYSKGGAQRRCDGTTELISGRGCMCDPDARVCTPTTHILLVLPDLPDIGTWRLVSRGWNAAAELPATIDLLMQLLGQGIMPAAQLAIEKRTSVTDGQTHHFSVPVLRTTYSLRDLERQGIPVLTGGRRSKPPIAGERPALPEDARFQHTPDLGPKADLPDVDEDGGHTVGSSGAPEGDAPPLSTTTSSDEDEGNRLDGAEVGGDEPGSDVPAVTSESGSSEHDEVLRLLLAACLNNPVRAATFVNKASKTNYTSKTILKATVDELKAGLDAVEAR